MTVLQHAHAAGKQRDGADDASGATRIGAKTQARCACSETERQRAEECAGQTRAVMQRQPGAEETRESRRDPGVERRFFHEWLAGIDRNTPIAAGQHVVDDAKGVCLVLLPRIMAKDARYKRIARFFTNFSKRIFFLKISSFRTSNSSSLLCIFTRIKWTMAAWKRCV